MTPLLEATVSLPPRLAETHVVVASGERIAVIGPNGSGKTTLLRAIAGIEGQSAEATIAGEALASMSPNRRLQNLSFLPASREVRWPIPVRDVIALGLSRPDQARVEELLARLRLTGLADRPIDRLSTGERARALLGRALAPRPRLLLLDEPLSNLDPAWVLRTLDYLDDVARDGTAIVMALHDLAQLSRFDRVWMLDRGQMVADVTPGELFALPRFAEVFEVEPDGAGWTLSPSADRRSSR
ncbi:ABC transporter ATP-binding protein [Sphingomonas glaciei]|uniref:ABC transporter ATP-binding protein n=1 Tax=Sphingomonas glaciei TaxID=2938948 RepID=A0ABY5MX93_9SPHN|nr:ABC transporter ATP-binding protein [Sphingomonas glaciei]UUR08601.1 ABC transporter ATP-binding protein [Sphingomonas glaciei]